MDDYLNTTNNKIAVFRDVIIEADYNPLAANEASIRVPTGVTFPPQGVNPLQGEST